MTCEHKRIPRIEILFFKAFSFPLRNFHSPKSTPPNIQLPLINPCIHPFPRTFELFHRKNRAHNPSHAWLQRKSLVYDRGQSLILYTKHSQLWIFPRIANRLSRIHFVVNIVPAMGLINEQFKQYWMFQFRDELKPITRINA